MKIDKPGFPFSFESSACEGCGGKCCTGESGYVFVNLDEMHAIASALNMAFEDFTLRYVRRVGSRFSLIEIPKQGRSSQRIGTLSAQFQNLNGEEIECVFFEHGRCAIYDARPSQCRSYPFWEGHRELDSEGIKRLMDECCGVQPKEA